MSHRGADSILTTDPTSIGCHIHSFDRLWDCIKLGLGYLEFALSVRLTIIEPQLTLPVGQKDMARFISASGREAGIGRVLQRVTTSLLCSRVHQEESSIISRHETGFSSRVATLVGVEYHIHLHMGRDDCRKGRDAANGEDGRKPYRQLIGAEFADDGFPFKIHIIDCIGIVVSSHEELRFLHLRGR